jgi:radical SAM superfamily enzyme YgiQ (UPF0313 family)
LPALAEWQRNNGHPFTFLTEASINLADDEPLLESMQQAGFRRVFIGIETPDSASLIEAQKTQNRGNLLEQVKLIQSFGMEVMAGFIVGFDSDTEDIFQRQIKFIRESAIPLAMVGLLEALPDTQLWKRLEREGRLLGEAPGNNTKLHLNFVPKMDPKLLIAGYQLIMENIYSSGEYYQRTLDSMQRTAGFDSERNYGHPLNVVVALVRIFFKLGVMDEQRGDFWKYFARVYAEHRDRLPDFLRLACMGYHFRRLTAALAE